MMIINFNKSYTSVTNINWSHLIFSFVNKYYKLTTKHK